MYRWANKFSVDWLHDWIVDTETTFKWFLRDCSEVCTTVDNSPPAHCSTPFLTDQAGPKLCPVAKERGEDPAKIGDRLLAYVENLYEKPIAVPHANRPGILTAGAARSELLGQCLYRNVLMRCFPQPCSTLAPISLVHGRTWPTFSLKHSLATRQLFTTRLSSHSLCAALARPTCPGQQSRVPTRPHTPTRKIGQQPSECSTRRCMISNRARTSVRVFILLSRTVGVSSTLLLDAHRNAPQGRECSHVIRDCARRPPANAFLPQLQLHPRRAHAHNFQHG